MSSVFVSIAPRTVRCLVPGRPRLNLSRCCPWPQPAPDSCVPARACVPIRRKATGCKSRAGRQMLRYAQQDLVTSIDNQAATSTALQLPFP
eukprot:365847-Chlamydomonas_euryale.AAC.20